MVSEIKQYPEGQVIMKAAALALLICFVFAAAAAADAPAKVTLKADAMAIKDAADEIAKQAAVPIVVDPRAKGTITTSLTDADLSQALDVITKPNNLTWKKLEFARKADAKVTLDQLKSGIVALASMELLGLAVQDPTTGTGALFAKDIPAGTEVPKPALPEGYSWTTVYVVLAPEPKADESAASKDKVSSLAQTAAKQMAEIAALSPEERKQFFADYMAAQMKLAPEARQAMLRDQIQAVMSMDQQARDQFRADMRAVFSSMPRGSFGGPGGGRPQGQSQGQGQSSRRRSH